MAIQANDALVFGIYPGGFAGGGTPNPVPDDPARIEDALAQLQGGASRFLVRGYRHFKGTSEDLSGVGDDPAEVGRYLAPGRQLDLVLEYMAPGERLREWVKFVRETLRRDGLRVATLSITLEENLDEDPLGRAALVGGARAAKFEARDRGLELEVGFNVAAFGIPYDRDFWSALGELGEGRLAEVIDYVGADLWAGVFLPPALGTDFPDADAAAMAGEARRALELLRSEAMPAAGLGPEVKIRVTEAGWPTGPGRAEAEQAEALRALVETVHSHRRELGIASFEFFDLRDARTAHESRFDRLGLMRDDYTPKPAFAVYRRLITEFGG